MTLLALGPLTNVAEALQSNPKLVDNIESIYITVGIARPFGYLKVFSPASIPTFSRFSTGVSGHDQYSL
jgi:hypothetical protein